METALSQAFRAATRAKDARNGSGEGTIDNLRTDAERSPHKQASSLLRKTLWRERGTKGARVHEGNQAK